MNCQFQNFGVVSILAFRVHSWLVELVALVKKADAYWRRLRHIYAMDAEPATEAPSSRSSAILQERFA
jgi:hypothetical protein